MPEPIERYDKYDIVSRNFGNERKEGKERDDPRRNEEVIVEKECLQSWKYQSRCTQRQVDMHDPPGSAASPW